MLFSSIHRSERCQRVFGTGAAWQKVARNQYLSRLANPVFIPLGGPRIYPACGCPALFHWRAQYLSRLASPVFIPLGGPCVYPAWRAQCLSRLADPVFILLGGPSIYPAWRALCLSRLANPVFFPLGEPSIYPTWRTQCLSRLADPVFIPLEHLFPASSQAQKSAAFRQRFFSWCGFISDAPFLPV